MATQYTVGIAGSTDHTRMCAEALRMNGQFEISWVLTPPPQPIGRKQIVTKNALHLWAEDHRIPVVFVEGKLREELQSQLQPQPDFLLVVDFGYLVPKWLLGWPAIAPLNIHPSLLPRWRGSSPGQFVLLHGEKNSAVTIMIMGEGLDTGPILWQGEFAVEPNWTQTEYYQHSFELAAKKLPEIMIGVASGDVKPVEQPVESPTRVAKRFKKDDGFVSWREIAEASWMEDPDEWMIDDRPTSPFLQEVQQETGHDWAQVIADAVHGLSPWPGVWTLIPALGGMKRMKILETTFENEKLILEKVQLEGETPIFWSEWKSRHS